jgi:predicted Zn-dependent protease
LIVLQAQERGDDPRAAAEHFLRANAQGLELIEHGAFRGAEAPAYRARARLALSQGSAGAELFWLAHRGTIFRLDCLAAEQSFSGFVAPFERTALSFRALSAEERAGARERRLAVVPARAGESLGALAERTGNVWRLEQVALANGAEPAAALAAGLHIKVVVERPYAAAKE